MASRYNDAPERNSYKNNRPFSLLAITSLRHPRTANDKDGFYGRRLGVRCDIQCLLQASRHAHSTADIAAKATPTAPAARDNCQQHAGVANRTDEQTDLL
jgi:hypothetical protein